MTQVLFEEWLISMNTYFRIQNRKVLLLVDNAPSHGWDRTINLDNIRVEFLPPNMTSRIQPMDAGIIANFKAKYRALHLRHLVNIFDQGEELEKINIRQAINFTVHAWESVKQETIANCWKTTGILPNVIVVDSCREVDETIRDIRLELRTLISELPSIANPMSVESFLEIESELGAQAERAWTDEEI